MKIKLFYIAVLCYSIVLCQEQASNWYFGENSGINFNSADGTVSFLSDSSIQTKEGNATISDEDGNLLFYTDGITVYNKNHFVMANGSGLLGDSSSSQSAIIVPMPENPSLYYIFTVGSNQNANGLKYSIVDMSMNSGNGAVTSSKNINLLSYCSEKISAVVKDCSSGSIWIIAFSNQNGISPVNPPEIHNTFHAFELTPLGLNNISVKSTFNINIVDVRGYLKLSPDGTKLACANVQDGLFICDFDTLTGQASNLNVLQIYNPNNKPYGIEFSPNGEFLYATSSNDNFGDDQSNPNSHNSVLLQYDLTNSNISGSQVILDERQLFRGALQLGPDGKIYRALSATYEVGSNYLGVIDNPNTKGVGANYIHNAVFLGDGVSTQGLPPFVQSIFTEKMDIIRNGYSSTSLTLCQGESYTLVADVIPNAVYTWTLNGKYINNTTNTLNVTESGNYEVDIEDDPTDCNTTKGQANIKFVTFPQVDNAALTQCEDDVIDGRTTFNLNDVTDDILVRPGDITVTYFLTLQDAVNNENKLNPSDFTNTSNPQTIYASAINNGLLTGNLPDGSSSNPTSTACNSYAEVTLEVVNTSLGNLYYSVCDDIESQDGISAFDFNQIASEVQLQNSISYPISFYKSRREALLRQNQISSPYENEVAYTQTIYALAEDGNNCGGIGEIHLNVNALPNLITQETVIYCLNTFPATISIDAGLIDDSPSNYSYNWSTGEITYSIDINQPGTYSVDVINSNNCSKTRTIMVESSNIASIESIDIIDPSINNVITVLVTGEGQYEYALYDEKNILIREYQLNNIFENVGPGFYTLNIRDFKNDCGIVNEAISVIGFPKYFTPNNDGDNDTWQVYGISGSFQATSKIYIYDRYGKLLKQLNPSEKGWDGTLNGKKLPTDDYWFHVTLQDGRVFKSHFTLKY